MQKRFILCVLLCAGLLLCSNVSASLPKLSWIIDSKTSGVMHGRMLDMPGPECVPGQVYVGEGVVGSGPDPNLPMWAQETNVQSARSVGLCRVTKRWSLITPENYERLKVVSKELMIPLVYAQITTAIPSNCGGCAIEYAWDSSSPQESRIHTAVMVRSPGGMTRDWTASAAKRGKVDLNERALVEQAANDYFKSPKQMAVAK
jgi:hypothetical protein